MHFSRGRDEWLRAFAYLITIGLLALFYAAISYHAHQRFTTPGNGGWYGELARAFQQGQVSLLSKPSPGLLADPNPYGSWHDYPFKWDMSYYKGKYYTYFGPVPVVLFFLPWQIFTGHVLNQAFCFWLLCIAQLVLFALFMATMVRLYFSSAPTWIQVLILAVFGLGDCQGFNIHYVLVYEIAEITAAIFVLAMFYLLFLALHDPRRMVMLTALASLCWGAAVGSRPMMLFYGVAFVPFLYHAFKERGVARALKGGALIALPAVVVGLLLAWYNYARFGNPLDFGFAYQLQNLTFAREPTFRLRYLPMGLTDILFMPPRPSGDFPYLFPDPPQHNFFNPRVGSSKYMGVAFSLPILCYGLLRPRLQLPPQLRFFRGLLVFTGVVVLLIQSCYCDLIYRYVMDFLTPFFLLMAIGLVAAASAPPPRFAGRPLFLGAAAWSLYMGFALSVIGEMNGIHNLHTYPPPAGGEPWLPDGEKTPPQD